ncbi:MAG: N-acetyltransferase [Deltaproteobacteria bacterium]|nr:N-acetyltransferase [Deltaproteobacteria bacterium]
MPFASSITSIPAADWDALANPAGAEWNPFVSHAFLAALESSGSATAATGWTPHHLFLRDFSGFPQLAAPCYHKAHSLGEYVFDHAWADAYHRAGGHYYPKLQVAVPFTPVSGPRLLAATPELRAQALEALRKECRELGASSVHVTFLPADHAANLATPGWLPRTDLQFHWYNQDYPDFDAFLASLSHGKRKQIRRERQAVAAAGVSLRWVLGGDIREADWDTFFAFYQHTGARKWGRPYLTREFFSILGASMPDAVALLLAERDGRTIGGALNLLGSHALFGRYWGALEDVPFLHFEACYYQAIELAIARNLQRVEAGAQGPHKLARGYLPMQTHSLHHLAHPGLARAVADYLQAERAAVAHDRQELLTHAPFRRDGQGHATAENYEHDG